jgi:hypothetical protein
MELKNRLGRSKSGRTTYMLVGAVREPDGSFRLWFPGPRKGVERITEAHGLHPYLVEYERMAAEQEAEQENISLSEIE